MAAPIRARDVRTNIKDYGFEQGIVVSLEALLDEQSQNRQHLREVVSLLDQCIDQLNKLSVVGDGLARTINQIRREQKNEDTGE